MKNGKLTPTEEEFQASLKALLVRYKTKLIRHYYFSTGSTTWEIKGEDISVELAHILKGIEDKKVEM